MTTPHKDAEFIHAWADGKEIQCRLPGCPGTWVDFYGTWDDRFEYRIKPAAPVIETKMTDEELESVYDSAQGIPGKVWPTRVRGVANAAIARAIADGQVVPVVAATWLPKWVSVDMYEQACKAFDDLESEYEKLKSERAKRDMAVAEATKEAVMDAWSRAEKPKEYAAMEGVDLAAIIAKVDSK